MLSRCPFCIDQDLLSDPNQCPLCKGNQSVTEQGLMRYKVFLANKKKRATERPPVFIPTDF